MQSVRPIPTRARVTRRRSAALTGCTAIPMRAGHRAQTFLAGAQDVAVPTRARVTDARWQPGRHGGQGAGDRIRQRMTALFDSGTPLVATDPDPGNPRAIAVDQKLGFRPAGPPLEEKRGRILPMVPHPQP